jgi:plastocyanin
LIYGYEVWLLLEKSVYTKNSGKMHDNGDAAVKPKLIILIVIIVAGSITSLVAYDYYLKGQVGPHQSGGPPSTGTNYSGSIIGNFQAPTVLAASDLLVNYTFTVTSIGNVPSSATITSATPPGISVTFNPSQVTISQGQSSVINAQISVSQNVTPSTYDFTVTFTGGGFVQNESLSVQVVKYLVVTVGESFIPKNITVPAGSTVIWYRLNGVLSQYDSGVHNVVFTNGMASSPPLQQYQSWSYTFTKSGVYNYECTYHLPFMIGVVNVE